MSISETQALAVNATISMPIISVVVASFNSADYLQDCLESIKNQTYDLIELIVTDDASTDDTVRIAKTWLALNQSRFTQSSRIITSETNTGITANLNRGTRSARGTYIKVLAADDLLIDDAIETLIYAATQSDAEACFSRVAPLPIRTATEQLIIFESTNNYDRFFNQSRNQRYTSLLRNTAPHTLIVGSLFERVSLDKLGHFDERYVMMEDYPLLIAAFGGSTRIALIDKVTAHYRTKPAGHHVFNRSAPRYSKHRIDLMNFRSRVVVPELIKRSLILSLIFVWGANAVMRLEGKTNSIVILNFIALTRKLIPLWTRLKQAYRLK